MSASATQGGHKYQTTEAGCGWGTKCLYGCWLPVQLKHRAKI